VRSIIVAVNKMDSVDWSKLAFDRVVDEIQALARDLDFTSVSIIPVSASARRQRRGEFVHFPGTKVPRSSKALESSRSGRLGAHDHARRAPAKIQWVLRNRAAVEPTPGW